MGCGAGRIILWGWPHNIVGRKILCGHTKPHKIIGAVKRFFCRLRDLIDEDMLHPSGVELLSEHLEQSARNDELYVKNL